MVGKVFNKYCECYTSHHCIHSISYFTKFVKSLYNILLSVNYRVTVYRKLYNACAIMFFILE